MRIRPSLAALAVLPLSVGFTSAAVPVPVLASSNVELVTTIPDVGAISTAFDPEEPVMYVNTLNGVTTYDISDPAAPVELGRIALPHFENEGMDVGVRPDGTRYVFVGVDLYAVKPTSPDGAVTDDGSYLMVVEVTDPANPTLIAELDTATSTHTVQCADAPACTVLYTAGVYEREWEAIDLTDPHEPKIFDQTFTNPIGAAHQWTRDEAGYLWGASWDGAAAMDVTDPYAPRTAASTDVNAQLGRTSYNDFIIHNVVRPHANAFTVDDETGVSATKETATPLDGNVLLVTEEDYDDPRCQGGAGEGAFSTWYVPQVDADAYVDRNPEGKPGKGAITPLDMWNTEILDSGQQTIAGAFCSAHYFTFHQDGFVAQGWYQQGTRILDVRDPKDIKQVGYFFTGASETWHAYWVPERDETGAIVDEQKTDLVYTNDVVRGIDVLRVSLPETDPVDTVPVVAPILPQWFVTDEEIAGVSAPSQTFGYACRLVR